VCGSFRRWHSTHAFTNFVMSEVIFGHQNRVISVCQTFSIPIWTPGMLVCTSSRIDFTHEVGTYVTRVSFPFRFFLRHNTPLRMAKFSFLALSALVGCGFGLPSKIDMNLLPNSSLSCASRQVVKPCHVWPNLSTILSPSGVTTILLAVVSPLCLLRGSKIFILRFLGVGTSSSPFGGATVTTSSSGSKSGAVTSMAGSPDVS